MSEIPGMQMQVRLLSLPTREVLSAAHDETAARGAAATDRLLVVVRLQIGRWEGWGECSALNRPTYSNEDARQSFLALSGQSDDEPGPMAQAATVMAMRDLTLKRRNVSLASDLAGWDHQASVPAGAALGIANPDTLAARAADLFAAGYQRIKIKVMPDHVTNAARVVRDAAPGVELQVDGNGSFGPDDIAELACLEGLGVAAIEQPFAVDDVSSAASLVQAVEIPVVADEAVTTVADAERLAAAGALSGVSIKAPRVGGIPAAIELLDWCVDRGMAATAGGMLESGLGRHALTALAAHPGFTLAGDISPAQRWLAADPWPDVAMVGGPGAGVVLVPTGAGVAPSPDPELLDEYTIDQSG